jgi:HSP20 family molecular chaperone IbpA
MSLFPSYPTSEFGPLFRLLEDYDDHRSNRGRPHHVQQGLRAFQPKFDVRETDTTYELHGELPGIDQSNISVEFSDPHTLVVKGRVEREYHADPDGHPVEQGRITGDVSDQHQQQSRQASVKDEEQEESGSKSTPAEDQQVAKQEQPKHPKAKYWVTERSVGEFHRSFGFPTRVDQDNVKASLKNGILTVTVPKAPAHQAKKINID